MNFFKEVQYIKDWDCQFNKKNKAKSIGLLTGIFKEEADLKYGNQSQISLQIWSHSQTPNVCRYRKQRDKWNVRQRKK